jgi:hypothetical protein
MPALRRCGVLQRERRAERCGESVFATRQVSGLLQPVPGVMLHLIYSCTVLRIVGASCYEAGCPMTDNPGGMAGRRSQHSGILESSGSSRAMHMRTLIPDYLRSYSLLSTLQAGPRVLYALLLWRSVWGSLVEGAAMHRAARFSSRQQRVHVLVMI